MSQSPWYKDQQAVIDYLLSFNLFPTAPEEGLHYINYSHLRWTITLDMIPAAPPGGKLLELGSSPYFMSLLLQKSFAYELSGVNFSNDDAQPRGHYTFTAVSEALGEEHEFPYDYLNMETERLPYQDNEFDVVLLCEVIEHLTLDPAFVLAEAHRVLKPDGCMIVTTPNLVRWENLYLMLVGENISDQYSGYGASGRHNREYTPRHILQLMIECGFREVRVNIHDQHKHKGLAKLAKRIRAHWRDNIFAIGTKRGHPRYVYPSWLYRSMHTLIKPVSPLIVIGENDVVQLKGNWHPVEVFEDQKVRWSCDGSQVYLPCLLGQQTVTFQVNGLALSLGSVELSITDGKITQSFSLIDDEWHDLAFTLPTDIDPDKPIKLLLNVDRMRQHKVDRQVGIMVRQIAMQ
jgi:SAM-dependent methyltransferase